VDDDKVPGLVALVAHGDDVHVETLGTVEVGERAVERASLYRIASTTKPITATATLALVREGLFELDEPVDRLLPELANRRVLRRMDGPLDDTLPATDQPRCLDPLRTACSAPITVDVSPTYCPTGGWSRSLTATR
jgi:CubicO group peptidase (beta-lactamase class C family)